MNTCLVFLDVNITKTFSLICLLFQKLTLVFLCPVFPCSAAAGYRYPLTFQLDEWTHECVDWGQEVRGGGVADPDEGGGGLSVCLSVCCVNTGDQQSRRKHRHETNKRDWETLGWSWVVLLVRVWPEGEGGETAHRFHPFFTHIHLSIDSEAQLAKNKDNNDKKKCTKWTQFQLFCGLHLWWIKKKTQLSTC